MAPYTIGMGEYPSSRLSDALVEWIVSETEAGTSEVLEGLGPTELLFLAGAVIAKGEERPRNDGQLPRYLRAADQLMHRAIAAGLGR